MKFLVVFTLCFAPAWSSTVLSWNLNSVSKNLVNDIADPSETKPLIVFVMPQFNLGKFSQAADVYSPKSTGDKLATLKAWMAESANQNVYRMQNAYATIKNDIVSKIPSSKQQTDGSLSLLKRPSVVIVNVADFDKLEEAVKTIKTNLSGTAYTAVLVGEEEPHLLQKRAVAVTDDPKAPEKLFYTDNNCLFTIDGAVLYTGCFRNSDKAGRAKVHLKMPPSVDGTCQKKPGKDGVWESANITLTFDGVAPEKDRGDDTDIKVTSLKVSLNFAMDKKEAGYWGGTVMIEELKGDKVPQISSARQLRRVDNAEMGSVTSFSYSCEKTPVYCAVKKGKDKDDEPNVGIAFEKFRVEPFGADTKTRTTRPFPVFNDADDCVGFFSVGTLMGLMAGIVLLLVFFFGICMISGISTMDKFDDPRQKPLQINVRE